MKSADIIMNDMTELGYPDGLHGEEIPLCAQVVGLADAYDALISPRPYKSKLTHGEALQMILNGGMWLVLPTAASLFSGSGNAEGMDKKGR